MCTEHAGSRYRCARGRPAVTRVMSRDCRGGVGGVAGGVGGGGGMTRHVTYLLCRLRSIVSRHVLEAVGFVYIANRSGPVCVFDQI